MHRRFGLIVLVAVLSLVLTVAAAADSKKKDSTVDQSTVTTQTTSVNNGGGTPSCGNSCDQSHNPTDYEKPCAPVPGNGCHTLPDTPCERGHGGTEVHNKHCGSAPVGDLTIVKEQRNNVTGSTFTHDTINAGLSTDIHYQITVTNNTDTDFTLTISDPVCTTPPNGSGILPSGTQTVTAGGGVVVYTCDVDANPGVGEIPIDAASGPGPYTLTNTVNVTASPVGGGTDVPLTDTVVANIIPSRVLAICLPAGRGSSPRPAEAPALSSNRRQFDSP